MKYLFCYLILINAAAFMLMLADKFRAKRKLWRIPERTLLFVALIGGCVGALSGMYLVRHKTKHRKFTLGIPIILAFQIIIAVIIASKSP